MAMISDYTAKTSKLAKTILANAVVNASYLQRGATKVDESQVAGKRNGQSYSFVIDDITAQQLTPGTAMAHSLTSTAVDLTVQSFGAAFDAAGVQKALDLDNFEDLAQQIGAKIANETSKQVALQDIVKKNYIVKATGFKAIYKESAKLASSYTGKIYSWVDPVVIGDIAGSGRDLQPVEVDARWGVGLEGRMGNCAEMRSMNLPHAYYAGNSATHTWAVGDLVFGKDGQCALATVAGTVPSGVTADTSNADAEYVLAIMRVEGAQAYGDAGVNLNGEKKTAEGLTIAMHEVESEGFKTVYEFADAIVCGIAAADKMTVVAIPA